MKNILTYILITFSLTSCLEQLEDLPQSFERVYGTEGTSVVSGMLKRNNGHLLMYGRETKPAFNDGSDFTIPFIIETDEFGNEVQSRNYGFYEGKFKIQLTSWDVTFPGYYGTNEFVAIRSALYEIIELSNGTFFCLGSFWFRPKNTDWPDSYFEYDFFYLLLDENLEPLKWGLFNDTTLEGPGRFWFFLGKGAIENSIVELPSGDILFSSFGYREWRSDGSEVGVGFAIYKFSPLTQITEVWRYDSGDPDLEWQARDFVLGTDGSSLVVTVNQIVTGSGLGDGDPTTGSGLATTAVTSLFRIDLSSGEVLNTVNYNTRGLCFNVAHHENGYVMKAYHPDPADDISDGDREWWGSLLFVNENLDSIRLENISEKKDIQGGGSALMQTRDGGYVAEFYKNNDNGGVAVLIKTDRNGKPLWRHEESGNSSITDIVEMDDGGIVYSVLRDYNGIGDRIALVKLTPDGKL